ncbi:uncharacterized protein [Drosophila virilis]|uniref:Tes134 n=1 Tax=Drosophila virilis TaxID=7244 RepID=B4LWW2_DROVI|nr:uncharacterized protein LOC6629446 [Drosophila virilis]EDW66683.1 uncharacterized protein Dvir_GJ23735 [Drosophila virilis]
MEDIFFDCCSEGEAECETILMQREGILKAGKGDAADHCLLQSKSNKYDDPIQIRDILHRAANSAQILLHGLGGHCEYTKFEPQGCKCFYPATLEITTRVHTESSCGCPPHCQCVLRGSPVTLKLPLELNPHNGQVNVKIFQPSTKQLTGAGEGVGGGDKRASNPSPNNMQRHSQRREGPKKIGRRVRWDA